jgi:hypothetical protein
MVDGMTDGIARTIHAPQASATLSADGRTVTHRKATWSHTFPVADLPQKIARYRGLRDRDGRKYEAFYRDDVAALEAVQAQIEARKRA